MIAPTSRLSFEPITPDHAPHFYGLNGNTHVMCYFLAPLSADDTDAFIARIVRAMASGWKRHFYLKRAFLLALSGCCEPNLTRLSRPRSRLAGASCRNFGGGGLRPKAPARLSKRGLPIWRSRKLCRSRRGSTRRQSAYWKSSACATARKTISTIPRWPMTTACAPMCFTA